MKIWIWNGGAFLTVLAISILWPTLSTKEDRSRIAPYRFALASKPDSDDDLAFFQDRVARTPEGLDLASLSRAYLKKARRTGQGRWIDDAETAARRSLDALPVSNSGAILALAQAAQMKHDFSGSIALCDRALRERPNDRPALALKATAQLGLGDIPGALRSADALVDRAPISENLALRAVILDAHGDEREALHDFRKAASVEEPEDPEGSAWLRTMWARLALRRGRTDDAEDLLREALRIRPFFAPALGLLGDLELDRNRLDAADRAYADAFQSSADPAFLARRADVKSRKGDTAAAEELRGAAEKALRRSSGHRIALARILLEKGLVQEALSIAEDEATKRRNVETIETLARALLASERLHDARIAVREALRTGGLDARLHELAAEIESRLGCVSRARMHLGAAREIRP
jgi:tetratricopeptide (TPR) repeat protein